MTFLFKNKPHDYPPVEELEITEKTHRKLSLSDFRNWWFYNRFKKQKFFIGDIVRVLHPGEVPSKGDNVYGGCSYDFAPPPSYGIVTGAVCGNHGIEYIIGKVNDDPNSQRKTNSDVSEEYLLLVDRPKR